MEEYLLIYQVLLQFPPAYKYVVADLSAAAFSEDGSLWLGCDEGIQLNRLSAMEDNVFGNHQSFDLGMFFALGDPSEEIDIEGLCFDDGYLWICGSHSSKRKKPKGENALKDIQRLAEIKREGNRYFLARIPCENGRLFDLICQPEKLLRSACLQRTENGNLLTQALEEDAHLGLFLKTGLPGKDNGFDVEGLAVRGNQVFLGLRGPVLRGWAVILQLEVEETSEGILGLKKIGPALEVYRKHFLDLQGLGVRELCFKGDDLLILAGPTMTLDGSYQLFQWQPELNSSEHTITEANNASLKSLFTLPFKAGGDRAEGLTLMDKIGEENSILVVYDTPAGDRLVGESSVYADVFSLPEKDK